MLVEAEPHWLGLALPIGYSNIHGYGAALPMWLPVLGFPAFHLTLHSHKVPSLLCFSSIAWIMWLAGEDSKDGSITICNGLWGPAEGVGWDGCSRSKNYSLAIPGNVLESVVVDQLITVFPL